MQQLEETAADNAKVEQEVILLRKKVYGLNKSQSSPPLVSGFCYRSTKFAFCIVTFFMLII